jgi:hypothetical protein
MLRDPPPWTFQRTEKAKLLKCQADDFVSRFLVHAPDVLLIQESQPNGSFLPTLQSAPAALRASS